MVRPGGPGDHTGAAPRLLGPLCQWTHAYRIPAGAQNRSASSQGGSGAPGAVVVLCQSRSIASPLFLHGGHFPGQERTCGVPRPCLGSLLAPQEELCPGLLGSAHLDSQSHVSPAGRGCNKQQHGTCGTCGTHRDPAARPPLQQEQRDLGAALLLKPPAYFSVLTVVTHPLLKML